MGIADKKQRFPLGLVLFAVVLAVYKASIISGDSGTGLRVWALLIGLDLFYFSFLLVLAILLGVVKPGILRFPVWLLLVFMTAIYLVDSFVLLALDEHTDLFDIGRYALEDGVVLSFFDTAALGGDRFVAVVFVFIQQFYRVIEKSDYRIVGICRVGGCCDRGILNCAMVPLRHAEPGQCGQKHGAASGDFRLFKRANYVLCGIRPATSRYTCIETQYHSGGGRITFLHQFEQDIRCWQFAWRL